MHAFPSNETVKNFLQAVKNSRRGGVLLFFARIFYVLLRVANVLSFLWFDAIYAFIISVLLPLLIRKMIVGIV
ncbi:MAG: hypothetical protein HRU36_04065 [Rickettsiales bacterium]|nr:hypothetical protein [Rickettsiales bacterium]